MKTAKKIKLIESLPIGELKALLQNELNIHDLTWEHIICAMSERGYWCKITSPFDPDARGGNVWHAGFTPHGCIGWNGILDNRMSGDTGTIAIMRAALLTVMK